MMSRVAGVLRQIVAQAFDFQVHADAPSVEDGTVLQLVNPARSVALH